MDSKRHKSLARAAGPLFLYLTTFRRNASTTDIGPEELRDQLKRRLEQVRGTLELDPELGALVPRAWYALVVTCDALVLNADWRHSFAWTSQSLERDYFGTFVGGRRFYALADEVLAESGPQAVSLAGLLFHCLGLGFQGELIDRRTDRDRYRRLLYEKGQLHLELSDDKLTPGAYGHNVARDGLELPTARYVRFVAAAAAILVFAWIATGQLVARSQRDVVAAYDALGARVDAVAQSATADAPEADTAGADD